MLRQENAVSTNEMAGCGGVADRKGEAKEAITLPPGTWRIEEPDLREGAI